MSTIGTGGHPFHCSSPQLKDKVYSVSRCRCQKAIFSLQSFCVILILFVSPSVAMTTRQTLMSSQTDHFKVKNCL